MNKNLIIISVLLIASLAMADFPSNMIAGNTYNAKFNVTNNPTLFIFYINNSNSTPHDFNISVSFNNIKLNCTQNVLAWNCPNPDSKNGVLDINLTLNIALEPKPFNYTFLAYGSWVKPIIVITSPVNKTTYNKEDVPLNFTINAPVVWIGYSLDNTKNKTIQGNTSLEGLKDGAHNITVYATDKSGNTGASNKVYFFYCLGDVNGDKRINWSDLLLVSSHIGQNCKSKNYNSNYDINDDCKINIVDVLIVLGNFGKTCR